MAVDFIATDLAANLVVPEAASLDVSSADAARGQRATMTRIALNSSREGNKLALSRIDFRNCMLLDFISVFIIASAVHSRPIKKKPTMPATASAPDL
ncbi:MAG: hypothetical protein C0508_30020 [Cyanobacteria bacterium PR.023]|nr:hypothetical protein [Cyanobacteria bacterium PR.023]